MKLELTPYHRNTSDTTLLADLKAVARTLKKKKITVAAYSLHGTYHPDTLIRRFGSWNKALLKAGLQVSKPHRIPTDVLFANLEKVWRRLGRQPSQSHMEAAPSSVHVSVYKHRFGTWRKALAAFVNYFNEGHHAKKPRELPAAHKRPAHKTSRNANWRLRFQVMQRDHFRCTACGRAPATDPTVVLHIDHITPWNKGGETELTNLQTLCSICNIGKSNTS